jgi:hypothetical protein
MCWCTDIMFFPKPSVRGFSTAADPADRSCRYLVQPPTVQGLARLRGYQRPPRGGRGRCRRACERTPLRGRRRCAADGRLSEPFNFYFLDLLKGVWRRGCCVQCASFALRVHEWSMDVHAAYTGDVFGKQAGACKNPHDTGLDKHYTL